MRYTNPLPPVGAWEVWAYTWEKVAIESRVRCLDAIIERMGKTKVAGLWWQSLGSVLIPMKDKDDEVAIGGIVVYPVVRSWAGSSTTCPMYPTPTHDSETS